MATISLERTKAALQKVPEAELPARIAIGFGVVPEFESGKENQSTLAALVKLAAEKLNVKQRRQLLEIATVQDPRKLAKSTKAQPPPGHDFLRCAANLLLNTQPSNLPKLISLLHGFGGIRHSLNVVFDKLGYLDPFELFQKVKIGIPLPREVQAAATKSAAPFLNATITSDATSSVMTKAPYFISSSTGSGIYICGVKQLMRLLEAFCPDRKPKSNVAAERRSALEKVLADIGMEHLLARPAQALEPKLAKVGGGAAASLNVARLTALEDALRKQVEQLVKAKDALSAVAPQIMPTFGASLAITGKFTGWFKKHFKSMQDQGLTVPEGIEEAFRMLTDPFVTDLDEERAVLLRQALYAYKIRNTSFKRESALLGFEQDFALLNKDVEQQLPGFEDSRRAIQQCRRQLGGKICFLEGASKPDTITFADLTEITEALEPLLKIRAKRNAEVIKTLSAPFQEAVKGFSPCFKEKGKWRDDAMAHEGVPWTRLKTHLGSMVLDRDEWQAVKLALIVNDTARGDFSSLSRTLSIQHLRKTFESMVVAHRKVEKVRIIAKNKSIQILPEEEIDFVRTAKASNIRADSKFFALQRRGFAPLESIYPHDAEIGIDELERRISASTTAPDWARINEDVEIKGYWTNLADFWDVKLWPSRVQCATPASQIPGEDFRQAAARRVSAAASNMTLASTISGIENARKLASNPFVVGKMPGARMDGLLCPMEVRYVEACSTAYLKLREIEAQTNTNSKILAKSLEELSEHSKKLATVKRLQPEEVIFGGYEIAKSPEIKIKLRAFTAANLVPSIGDETLLVKTEEFQISVKSLSRIKRDLARVNKALDSFEGGSGTFADLASEMGFDIKDRHQLVFEVRLPFGITTPLNELDTLSQFTVILKKSQNDIPAGTKLILECTDNLSRHTISQAFKFGSLKNPESSDWGRLMDPAFIKEIVAIYSQIKPQQKVG